MYHINFWILDCTTPTTFNILLQDIVASTFEELQLTRAELKHSRDKLELSKSEAMATQLKMKFKEEEFSKERKLAGNARQFLEIRVEELEKILNVSPGFLL